MIGKKDWEKEIEAMSEAERHIFVEAVVSLNRQVMDHAKVDQNFQKDFAVKIDAPEGIKNTVIKQFSEDWTFTENIQTDELFMMRRYFDTNRRSAELKAPHCESSGCCS